MPSSSISAHPPSGQSSAWAMNNPTTCATRSCVFVLTAGSGTVVGLSGP